MKKIIILLSLCIFTGIVYGDNWTLSKNSKSELVNNQFHSGKYSLKITGSERIKYSKYNLKPNTKYLLSFWAKSDAGLTRRSKMYISFINYKMNGFRGGMTKPVYGGTLGWTKITKEFITPASCRRGTLNIKSRINFKEKGYFYIDDIVLNQENNNKNIIKNSSFERKIISLRNKKRKSLFKNRFKNKYGLKSKKSRYSRYNYNRKNSKYKRKQYNKNYSQKNKYKKKNYPEKHVIASKTSPSKKTFSTSIIKNGILDESKVKNVKQRGSYIYAILAQPIFLDMDGQKIKLQTGKKITYRFQDKRILSAYLAENTPLRIGNKDFVFEANSKIRLTWSKINKKVTHYFSSGRLIANQKIHIGDMDVIAKKMKYDNNGDVEFSSNGKIRKLFLANTKKVIVGRYEVLLPFETQIYFVNDKISSFSCKYKKSAALYYGKTLIPAKSGSFYSNSSLNYVKLANQIKISFKNKLTVVPKNGRLYFNRTGKLIRISKR